MLGGQLGQRLLTLDRVQRDLRLETRPVALACYFPQRVPSLSKRCGGDTLDFSLVLSAL
jgi:hypothetical protein